MDSDTENATPTMPVTQSEPEKQLLLGIDLGTSRTAVMSDRGAKEMVRSVVGYAKDIISVKLLGAPCVIGETALDKRSFVNLHYPLEDGVIREIRRSGQAGCASFDPTRR